MTAISHVDRFRVEGRSASHDRDAVAIEEPLEIRVGDRPLSVTMRSPGDDFELAAGFLFTEGIIPDVEAIASMRHWGSSNVARISLREGVVLDLQRLQRHFYTASSCGVCGKASIDAIRVQAPPLSDPASIDPDILSVLPDRLRAEQKAFATTGALHAAGLFDTGGNLICAREDIGRHNAVDKAIGAILQRRAPMPKVLVVSGRAGFEIVQKAVVAGIPILAAVGGPSSLAIELACELNLTLAAFVRNGAFNVYAGAFRVGAASAR